MPAERGRALESRRGPQAGAARRGSWRSWAWPRHGSRPRHRSRAGRGIGAGLGRGIGAGLGRGIGAGLGRGIGAGLATAWELAAAPSFWQLLAAPQMITRSWLPGFNGSL